MKKTEIIGQASYLERIDKWSNNNCMPHFMLIMGEFGMGKKYITQYIADSLKARLYQVSVKPSVDEIKEIVHQAYTQTENIVYLLPDVSKMNSQVANILLKVTEEPPNNAYFVITNTSKQGIPKTLYSRCCRWHLYPYTKNDLRKIATIYFGELPNDIDSIILECETPGDMINKIKSINTTQAIKEFVIKVVNNVGKVSDSNVFKIAEKIAFTDTDTGFNLKSFWIEFSNECMLRAKNQQTSNRNMYFRWIKTTGIYRDKIGVSALNKHNLFDLWLLEIRNIYDDYN